MASSVAGRGDGELQDLLAFCARTLRAMRQAEDHAGIIDQYRRLDELRSAIDTLLTRFQIDILLGSVPGVTPGPGSSPTGSAAVERLRRAITVIARRDT